MTDVLRVTEVARALRCHTSHVYRLLKRGELKSIRVGGHKILRTELDKWIDEHSVKAKGVP